MPNADFRDCFAYNIIIHLIDKKYHHLKSEKQSIIFCPLRRLKNHQRFPHTRYFALLIKVSGG